MRKGVLIAAAFALGGCRHKAPEVEYPMPWRWADVGRPCTPDSPAFALPESWRDTSVHPFAGVGRKDAWEEKAQLSRTIPGGWGGISHRKAHPRTVVYLVDTTQLAAAVPALVSAGILSPNPTVGVIKGRWTYSELYDWFRYIHTHIRGVRVSGWALDEFRNRILYGLEDEAAATVLGERLNEMNAPCFLVAIGIWGRIHMGAPVTQIRRRE